MKKLWSLLLVAALLLSLMPLALAEDGEVQLDPEDAAIIERIEDEGLVNQAAMFKTIIPGPLTLKQSYNFAAYAGFILPDFVREWSLGGPDRAYVSLPDLMTFQDGTPVTSDPESLAARRLEMLDLLKEYVYGPVPTEGFTEECTVLENGTALDGKANRTQVQISITTDKGTLPVNLLLYTPAASEKAPIFLCLSGGNYTVLDDPAILPDASQAADDASWEEGRGSSAAAYQVADGIDRGYGYAFISVSDVAPDNLEGYATRLISLFDEPEMMALSGWAFGLSRAIDYLVTDPAVDADHIAVYGHSRYGKAALWTGANDERVAVTFSHQSGGGGAAMNRENNADNIHSLTKMEPWWFNSVYASYADRPDELPIDAHFTIACVAPRAVYMSNGLYDMWSDPQGSLNALLLARPMYEAYGAEVIPADYVLGTAEPVADQTVWTSGMSMHVLPEFHTASAEDWTLFFGYRDQVQK
ncbi:MAG: hypothetical protein IJ083_00360 [Clostridia bacterium]|nr:hypothetical protein [Clostridia bacterium]